MARVVCRDCFLAGIYTGIGSFGSKWLHAMGYHMAYVQYSMITIISLNRLSVLVKWSVFETIWKKYTWILIVLIVLLPFWSTQVVFQFPHNMEYVESLDKFSIISDDLPVLQIYSALIPFMIITMIIAIISNLSSILYVKSVKSKVTSSAHNHKAEWNFLIITSITCSIQLLATIITIFIMNFRAPPLFNIMFLILPFVSDGLSLGQAWLLVVFSQGIREKVKEAMGLDKQIEFPMFSVRSMTNLSS